MLSLMFRDWEHVAMPDLMAYLLFGPREGHLRLGGKEGAILVSVLPRRNFDSPSFDISPNIPILGAFNSYSLSLSWNGVAPGTLVSNFFARAS